MTMSEKTEQKCNIDLIIQLRHFERLLFPRDTAIIIANLLRYLETEAELYLHVYVELRKNDNRTSCSMPR